MGFIYFCKNLINNKGYVGQTSTSLKERKRTHIKDALAEKDDVIFHKAIRKYGEENFSWEVLEECDNNLLNEREIFWIKEKNTFFQTGFGYNMTLGGNANVTSCCKKVKAYKIENGKLINSRIFVSTREASRILSLENGKNFEHSKIAYICNGKGYSHHGYTFCYLDENNNDIPTGYHRTNKKIALKVFFNGEEIGEFPSIRQAAIKLQMHEETIKRKLDNQTEYKGYTFKYIN